MRPDPAPAPPLPRPASNVVVMETPARADRSLKGTEVMAPDWVRAAPVGIRTQAPSALPYRRGLLRAAWRRRHLDSSSRATAGGPRTRVSLDRYRGRGLGARPGLGDSEMQTRGLCAQWASGSSQGGLLRGARLRERPRPGGPSGLRPSPRLSLVPDLQARGTGKKPSGCPVPSSAPCPDTLHGGCVTWDGSRGLSAPFAPERSHKVVGKEPSVAPAGAPRRAGTTRPSEKGAAYLASTGSLRGAAPMRRRRPPGRAPWSRQRPARRGAALGPLGGGSAGLDGLHPTPRALGRVAAGHGMGRSRPQPDAGALA